MTKTEVLKRGRPKGDFDLLQASFAKQFNLFLVTHNLDLYKDIVNCEDWTPVPQRQFEGIVLVQRELDF